MQPGAFLLLALLLQSKCQIVNGLGWTAPAYWGNPVGENSVGSVIFDPGIGTANPECYDTYGVVIISLISCPIGDSSYFTTNNAKVVLRTPYLLSVPGHAALIPDCVLMCQDATGNAVYTSLTVNIYNTINLPPSWNNTFPTSLTIQSVSPPQLLLTTPASDPDTDKTTNGRITYFVASLDGSPIAAGINDYLQYDKNGNSPNLLIVYTLPWALGSVHSLVVAATDNPVNATANVIVKNITITVGPGATIGTKINYPTTSTVAYIPQAQLFYTTTASSNCDGASIVICNNNWIWLVIAVASVVAIIIVIVVAVVCYRRYGNYYDSGGQPRRHHHQRKNRIQQQEYKPIENYQRAADPRYIEAGTRY